MLPFGSHQAPLYIKLPESMTRFRIWSSRLCRSESPATTIFPGNEFVSSFSGLRSDPIQMKSRVAGLSPKSPESGSTLPAALATMERPSCTFAYFS